MNRQAALRRPPSPPLALAILALLTACSAAPGRVPPGRGAVADLRDAQGVVHGRAELTEGADGRAVVRVEVSGLASGAHGVHVHAVGRCETPEFTSAGAHFDTGGHQHGLANPRGPHAGDLPDLVLGLVTVDTTRRTFSPPQAATHGSLTASLGASLAEVLDADGAALIVHRGPDDQRTDPSGNSGARVLCGVFGPAAGRRTAP